MLESPASKRFEVLRRIGEGAMGTVYEARDRESGSHVALKTLRACSVDALARFQREFSIARGLSHPNLVSLGELLSDEGEWSFTMELVTGSDFLEYVRGNARANDASEQRLRTAFAQLVEGVRALHEAGLVHRDIKPSNIRVTPEGRVVLLDFGLVALAGDEAMVAPHAVGTPEFMAPEQAAGEVTQPEADWYSVGVVLYEALTGRVPFTGRPLDVLEQKQRTEPKPPSAIAPNVPPDLDALCTALLRFDPSARPAARHILRALAVGGAGRGRVPHSYTSTTIEAPFIGRQRELEALRRAFEDARRGQSAAVIVHGESGIGKTYLVDQFVSGVLAAEPDTLVLVGRCRQRAAVAYEAWSGVVTQLARALGERSFAQLSSLPRAYVQPLLQMLPGLRSIEAISHGAGDLDGEPQPAREPGGREPGREPVLPAREPLELQSRAYGGMRELLACVTALVPVVLVIDNAHWIDEDSRALLAEVLRAPEAPPLLLIAIARTPNDAVEAARQLRDVIAPLPASFQRIEVGRLSEEESRELAARVLERSRALTVDADVALAREGEGHPFLIDALARAPLPASHGRDLTARISAAIGARFDVLDDLARKALDLIAMAEVPLTLQALAGAVAMDGAELAKRVGLLRVARLIDIGGARAVDVLDVSHDAVREAVLARITPDTHAALHKRLALAFEMTGGAADTKALAMHWYGAGDPDRAAKYAQTAAEEAAHMLAFRRAADLLELALAWREPPGEEGRRLRAELGDALVNAGRGALAARAFQLAASGAPAAEALTLWRRSAEQLLRTGHFEEALDAIRHVIARVGMRLPDSPLVAIFLFLIGRAIVRLRGLGFRERDSSQVTGSDLARIDVCSSIAKSLSAIDILNGEMLQTRHLLLALRAGEPFRIARAVAIEATYVACGGGATWRRTEALMDRAMTLAERSRRPEALAMAFLTRGYAHNLGAKFRRGRELLERAHEILRDECSGMAWEVATAHWNLVDSLAHSGALKELCRRQPLYLREARDRGDVYGIVNLSIGNANLARLVQGDVTGARAELATAMRQWPKQTFHVEHLNALLARVHADLYEDRPTEALAVVNEEWNGLRRSLLLQVQLVRVLARWLRAMAAIANAEARNGDVAALLAQSERDARAIERERWGWSIPVARLVRAGIASVRSDDTRARALLESAAAGFEANECASYAAVARRCLGAVLGGHEGAALIARTDAWFFAETVRNPQRFVAVFAPGFARFMR